MSDDKHLDENLIEGHEYDGIKEYDNPLPDWWLFSFLATIMFSFFYFIHFEFSGGQSIAEELKADLAAIESHKLHHPSPLDSDEELAKLLAVGPTLEEGKNVFAAKCAACHGPQLQGLIGPNLTDEFWIHGQGKLSEIAGVVRKGVLDKGMPPWETQLKDNEIKAVTVFIASQFNTHPPNPKAPQGEKIVGK